MSFVAELPTRLNTMVKKAASSQKSPWQPLVPLQVIQSLPVHEVRVGVAHALYICPPLPTCQSLLPPTVTHSPLCLALIFFGSSQLVTQLPTWLRQPGPSQVSSSSPPTSFLAALLVAISQSLSHTHRGKKENRLEEHAGKKEGVPVQNGCED